MNCNHDIPICAACIIRDLELRGWEFTQGQNTKWTTGSISYLLVPELKDHVRVSRMNNPYHVLRCVAYRSGPLGQQEVILLWH